MIWLDTSSNPPKLKLRNDANTGWTDVFTALTPPTKAQIGLPLVPNYSATSSLTDSSTTKFLLAAAGKNLQDNKLSKTGQAYDSARLGNKLANQYVLISGTYANLRAQATTKADVGLGNVQNHGITSSLTSNNASLYASAKAVYDLNNAKVNKTTTVNGKALTGNITLSAANVGAATPQQLSQAVASAVPPGIISMFAGTEAQIPAGYQLCNGSGQTSNEIDIPDLHDRFVVGAGSSYSPGDTGGSNSKSTNSTGAHSHSVSVGNKMLSVSQIPSHGHDVKSKAKGWVGSEYSSGTSGAKTVPTTVINPRDIYAANTGGSGAHNHSASSGSAGNHSHSVNVRPPYYALCYIIKL